MEENLLDISQFVMAAGAVGTAAMGIVEGFKSVRMQPLGFQQLNDRLDWARAALDKAYGSGYGEMMESLYRQSRAGGELPRILRQGVRIGLDKKNAEIMGAVVLGKGGKKLSGIADKIEQGGDLKPDEKNILGRFEVAADARIDAALSLAERAYRNGIRVRAFVVSFILSFGAAFSLNYGSSECVPSAIDSCFELSMYFNALIVGLVAVPLAPIAKDVAKGFQAAAKAIGGKS